MPLDYSQLMPHTHELRKSRQSLLDINQQAADALVKEMGIVNTLRFLGQFGVGTGNYTIDCKA
jgi:hypothetical protein